MPAITFTPPTQVASKSWYVAAKNNNRILEDPPLTDPHDGDTTPASGDVQACVVTYDRDIVLTVNRPNLINALITLISTAVSNVTSVPALGAAAVAQAIVKEIQLLILPLSVQFNSNLTSKLLARTKDQAGDAYLSIELQAISRTPFLASSGLSWRSEVLLITGAGARKWWTSDAFAAGTSPVSVSIVRPFNAGDSEATTVALTLFINVPSVLDQVPGIQRSLEDVLNKDPNKPVLAKVMEIATALFQDIDAQLSLTNIQIQYRLVGKDAFDRYQAEIDREKAVLDWLQQYQLWLDRFYKNWALHHGEAIAPMPPPPAALPPKSTPSKPPDESPSH